MTTNNQEEWKEEFEKIRPHRVSCTIWMYESSQCTCGKFKIMDFISSLLDTQKQRFLEVLDGLEVMNMEYPDGDMREPETYRKIDGFNLAVEFFNTILKEARGKV